MNDDDTRALVAEFQKIAHRRPRILVVEPGGHSPLHILKSNALVDAGFQVEDGATITTAEDAARRAIRGYVDAVVVISSVEQTKFASDVRSSLVAKQRDQILVTVLVPQESGALLLADILRKIKIAQGYVVWPLLQEFACQRPSIGIDRLHHWLRRVDSEVLTWGENLQAVLPPDRREAIGKEVADATEAMADHLRRVSQLPPAVWFGLFLNSESKTDIGTLKTYMKCASESDQGQEWYCSARITTENYVALPELTKAYRPPQHASKAMKQLLDVALPVAVLATLAEGVMGGLPDLQEVSFGWDSGDVFTWQRAVG